MKTNKERYKIGIIVGKGSGRILAEVFINFLKEIGQLYNCDFEFYVNSFEPIKLESSTTVLKYRLPEKLYFPEFSTYTQHSEKNLNETENLLSLLDKWNRIGIKYVFRTSINADILYQLRSEAEAVKVIETNFGDNELLIIRDEIHGFYSNNYWSYSEEEKIIDAHLYFSKKIFFKLLNFMIEILNEKATDKDEYFFWTIYKHHLFNGYIEKWIKDYFNNIEKQKKNLETKNININKSKDSIIINKKITLKFNHSYLFQPDTGLTKLVNKLTNQQKDKLVILVGNEVGDIIHEFLLNLEGTLQYKIALYTTNYYLRYSNFVVYQTVHGSADDKKSEEILPIATIRIAADILSNILQKPCIKVQTDKISKRILIKYLAQNIPLEEEKFELYSIYQQIANSLKIDNYGNNNKSKTSFC